MSDPETEKRFKRLEDVRKAFWAGMAMSRPEDSRGATFDSYLQSGEFAKSGLGVVASSTRSNFLRLLALGQLPMSFFNYGRDFQHEYGRLCREHGSEPGAPPEFAEDGSG